MNLEAIIVSVNYSDFLSVTLEKNHKHFGNIIIVTDTKDDKTEKVSNKYNNITLIKTDIFYQNGAKFNKGAAINVGLINSKYKDWVLLLDADIVLPENFREKLELDKECSYGARRYDVQTREQWNKIQNNNFDGTTLFRGIGYGFFFLFNYQSKIFQNLLKSGPPYPYWIPNGSESDWIFRNYWSDWIFFPPLDNNPNLHSIPNSDYAQNKDLLKQLPFNIIHLGETGINNEERKTNLWEL
jgi:hypothetical protein